MLTKADLQKAIRDTVVNYPAIAPLYQAGDPRILQHLDAMATMLALYSAQIETAMSEPFEKVRDATVLADAAMRGIIRKGTPARVRVRAQNAGTAAYNIVSGRFVLDSNGNYYRVETAVTVPAGGSATFEAVQLKIRTIPHTVSGSYPFYAIEIPSADDEADLCAIRVSDPNGEYTYRDRYVNTTVGERVYHVETDDRQRIYVRFGYQGVVGVQPVDGTVFSLAVSYTKGDVVPKSESPYSFEYMSGPTDAQITLTHDALLLHGAPPPNIATLRDLARYPSVYNAGAVFLGEFDFLVRRNFPSLRFLSVWNESAEEATRGGSLTNINSLFVACQSQSGAETVQHQLTTTPVQPYQFLDTNLTPTQEAIKAVILGADDSYRVRFYTPVKYAIRITVAAVVSTTYVVTDVDAQIREALMGEFGVGSEFAKRGRSRPLYKRIYALLREKVQALAHGDSDLTVSITDLETGLDRPELWRYVDENSITVTVTTANVANPSYGG